MTAPTADRPAPTQAQIDEVNARIDAALAPVLARAIVRIAREEAERAAQAATDGQAAA